MGKKDKGGKERKEWIWSRNNGVCICYKYVKRLGCRICQWGHWGTKRGKLSSQAAVGNTDQQMAHVSGNLFHHTKELLWDTTNFIECGT